MNEGKKLQDKLVSAGYNALYIRHFGVILMSACYGTDCAVTGKYRRIPYADCRQILAGKCTAAQAEHEAYERGAPVHTIY